MQATTETTLRVLIQTLPPNTKAKLIREWLAELPDERRRQESIERIVSRKETGGLLNKSLRGVDLLREQGHLKIVKMPGRTRGSGFLLSDVMALIAGKAAA